MGEADAPAAASSSAGGAPLLTGKYRLSAVLTHKGRSADSGHYVAWVRQPEVRRAPRRAAPRRLPAGQASRRRSSLALAPPLTPLPRAPPNHTPRTAHNCTAQTVRHRTQGGWLLYDDDKLSHKSDEDVLALSGGGDWHMAYLLLYEALTVSPAAAAAAAAAAPPAAAVASVAAPPAAGPSA